MLTMRFLHGESGMKPTAKSLQKADSVMNVVFRSPLIGSGMRISYHGNMVGLDGFYDSKKIFEHFEPRHTQVTIDESGASIYFKEEEPFLLHMPDALWDVVKISGSWNEMFKLHKVLCEKGIDAVYAKLKFDKATLELRPSEAYRYRTETLPLWNGTIFYVIRKETLPLGRRVFIIRRWI
jgi:hypothetical protein